MGELSAVLLAAGSSRRMGAENKLLLSVDGVPMVRRALNTLVASGLAEIVVVLGHEAERVAEAVADVPGVRTVVNAAHEEGQMSSVRAGLAALSAPCDGVLIALSDQPALTPTDLDAIRTAFFARKRGAVLVPTHGGQRGNPIVLDRKSVEEILSRGMKFGCKQLIHQNGDLVETVEMATDHILRDVDRPEDYAALKAL